MTLYIVKVTYRPLQKAGGNITESQFKVGALNCFSKNLPRRNIKDRRDVGRG